MFGPLKASKHVLRSGLALVCICAMSAVSAEAAAQMSIKEYKEFAAAGAKGDRNAGSALSLFLGGVWNAIFVSNEMGVSLGAPRRHCLPRQASSSDLVLAIHDELRANPAHWEKHQEQNVGALAIAAILRRWPCR